MAEHTNKFLLEDTCHNLKYKTTRKIQLTKSKAIIMIRIINSFHIVFLNIFAAPNSTSHYLFPKYF